jgi:hypothetical protein
LPDIQLATTQQVADFYEVDVTAIRMIVNRNRDEIESDGYSTWKMKDFLGSNKMLCPKITSYRGHFEVEFSNGQTENFNQKGIGLFTRRAILRVGMLLRDSEIAKEVRTQLLKLHRALNTVEIFRTLKLAQNPFKLGGFFK